LEQKYAKKQRHAERTKLSRQRAANKTLGSTCGSTDLHASTVLVPSSSTLMEVSPVVSSSTTEHLDNQTATDNQPVLTTTENEVTTAINALQHLLEGRISVELYNTLTGPQRVALIDMRTTVPKFGQSLLT